MTPGQRMKQQRERLGLRQSAAAREMGWSPGQLHNYETDKHEPKITNLRILSEVLCVTTDWICFGEGA